MKKFLTSLTTVGGLVTAGDFEAIQPADLPTLTTVAVTSFNTRTGAVTLTSADVNAADTHLAHTNADNNFSVGQTFTTIEAGSGNFSVDAFGGVTAGLISLAGGQTHFDDDGSCTLGGDTVINGQLTIGVFRLSPVTLGSPVNGLLEYDGSTLYFTTGGVRKTVTLV